MTCLLTPEACIEYLIIILKCVLQAVLEYVFCARYSARCGVAEMSESEPVLLRGPLLLRQRCAGSLGAACDQLEEPWGLCRAEWQSSVLEDESWGMEKDSERLKGFVQATLGSLMQLALKHV